MPSLDHLNAPQRAAVLHPGGPLVVFAGAGSGKTRVITHRVAHLLAEGGVPPWSILAVTFTNKAAHEMRERLTSLIGPDAGRLWVGTFHAICARLLRKHAERLGVRRDFTIYDDGDQQAMIKRVIKDLGIDDKRHPPRALGQAINRAKQELKRPADIESFDPTVQVIRDVFARYEERMEAAGALDFGDLIYRLTLGLEADTELRTELSRSFEHILVDEFQDTNHAQLRLVEALASYHRNLCVVGDDDQSIYRWRGADRRNILDFQRSFPDAVTIKLEQNYRSSQRILRAAHAIIRRNSDREPKELWTDNEEGLPILVVRTADELDEARMVVRGAEELRNLGQPLSDMAVFYRIHAQSRVLEEALRRARLPYRIVGGARFYERAEIKDVLAYLRVLNNPADDISFQRILNVPARGIGKTTEERLLAHAAKQGGSASEALDAIVAGDARPDGIGPAALRKLELFHALLASLRQHVDSGDTVAEIVAEVIERTGYAEALRAEDSVESEARLQNLEELHGSLLAYEDTHPEGSLGSFLEEITLDTAVEEGADQDKLTLMTVHAAKGLEFRTVFLTGMEERVFPFRGLEAYDDPEELEEERRLAYVAITRARARLIMSYAGQRMIFGQTRVGQPSRFIRDLPSEDTELIGGATRAAPQPARSSAPRRAPGESYLDTSEGCDLDAEELLRPGALVRHARFGLGRVREVTLGTPVRVRVDFDDVGSKNVVSTFLEPA